MTSPQTLVPEIRFEGFCDPWKERNLGELVSITTGKLDANAAQKDGKYAFFTCGKETLKTDSYSFDGDAILISGNGDLGFTRKYSGKFDAYQRTYVLQDFATDFEYLEHAVHRYLPERIKSESFGGAMPYIKLDTLTDLGVYIPQIEEAQKVSKFLNNIDDLIALNECRYNRLKDVKKSMLEKMFPRYGADVPEIRFAGFTNAWEQRKFSDITFPSGEKNKDNLPYESYSITNESGFVPQDEKFENGGTMRDADKRMYYIVSPQSFAYNPARINVGSIGYQNASKNVIVSSLYEVFKTTEDVDDRFLWHWFKSDDFQKLIVQLQEGGVRLYFYYDKLCMGTIALPSLAEQHRIGSYLDKLDNLITLHQCKCDKLKEIKNSLLQKMFV